jgi:hypothetical protein
MSIKMKQALDPSNRDAHSPLSSLVPSQIYLIEVIAEGPVCMKVGLVLLFSFGLGPSARDTQHSCKQGPKPNSVDQQNSL